MKKEWIRVDHQRHSNQLKRLSNSHFNQDQTTIIQRKKRSVYPMTMNCLSIDEFSQIESMSQNYDLHALNNSQLITIYSLNSSTLTDFLNNEEKVYKNLIEFFKSIPQFQQIDIEDQILLIKCNITHLVHIHHVLKDNFIENSQIGFQMTQWVNRQFHENMSKNRLKLSRFHQHPIILKISLAIFIFSINLSRLSSKQFDCQLNNPNQILENQNYFLTLLIKYLNRIYNENDSDKAIQTLVFQYLQYQLLMDQMELFIQNHLTDQHFLPLTKSVLRLTWFFFLFFSYFLTLKNKIKQSKTKVLFFLRMSMDVWVNVTM